jgi:hypothetical protein
MLSNEFLLGCIVVAVCLVFYVYNRKFFRKRMVLRLTKMVEGVVREKYREQKAKGEKAKEVILFEYLSDMERKLKVDGKEGRKIEFLAMVMLLYQNSFLKNRELILEYHDKASERLSD